MCGIIAAFKPDFPEASAKASLDRLYRRGPDAVGEWRDSCREVYLGHRRLAILDLDSRAAQPMSSACGRYLIVFNGEIYNFRQLRHSLETKGIQFRTTSDTEVLLALFAAEGADMLHKLYGMFAFVIWDQVEKKAFAARDPYGIKPLYIGTTGDGVILASQVKAILATGLVSRDPDSLGQAGFWMLGSVPEPHTWFRDIQAVPAGHCVWIERGRVVSSRCWQAIGDAWRQAFVEVDMPANEIVAKVRVALQESVARHLVADVPVGVFLSGGIDSGSLAGLMVEAGAHKLQGVTVAFDEFAGQHEDEVPAASTIARHYGISHHVRRVSREEFIADIPRIVDAMDQPTIDGVNTWYATKAVSELGLKVVVSGVGGDELFLGYGSFRRIPLLVDRWRRCSLIPGAKPLARFLGRVQSWRTGNRRWKYAPQWVQSIGGAWWLRRSLCSPDELPKWMGRELAEKAMAERTVQQWLTMMTGPVPANSTMALAHIEAATYLRNQLLRDSDWASMDHSVELRTPLVDVHLLTQLQPYLGYFHHFPHKKLLAQAPRHSLPADIVMRRKTGFGIPVKQWLARQIGSNKAGKGWQSWMKEVVRNYE